MEPAISSELVAHRLRDIRKSRSMSLLDVESASAGTIKAVVLGSYERGTRALSVKRAIQIADFYGIPVHHLFGSFQVNEVIETHRLTIDVRRMRNYAKTYTLQIGSENHLNFFTSLSRLITHLQNLREDWNGEIISLRSKDLDPLIVFLGSTKKEYITWLTEQKLLFTAKN
jgi:transcriptional regulator with XRE-family HTH domain